MPKFEVTYLAEFTYQIEAKDEDEAMETFLDGKCVHDRFLHFDIERIED
jgi:hypothetical protein